MKYTWHNITPDEAIKIMEEHSDHVILDVRGKDAYEKEHILGAISFPLDTINGQTVVDFIKDLDTRVFVYCTSGVKSVDACEKLVDLHFKHVYNLGGINDWPYDIVEREDIL